MHEPKMMDEEIMKSMHVYIIDGKIKVLTEDSLTVADYKEKHKAKEIRATDIIE